MFGHFEKKLGVRLAWYLEGALYGFIVGASGVGLLWSLM